MAATAAVPTTTWTLLVLSVAPDGASAAYALMQNGLVSQTFMAPLKPCIDSLAKMIAAATTTTTTAAAENSTDADQATAATASQQTNGAKGELQSEVSPPQWAFVVHGPGVLTVTLQRECAERGIDLPTYLKEPLFFDLRSEVGRFLQRHPDLEAPTFSLPDLAYFFSTEVVQPLISPLNQCLSIANIAAALLKYNYTDIFAYPVDTRQDRRQFDKERSNVVHLSSLPPSMTSGDLMRAFTSASLNPTHLYALRDGQGKASGAGFAEMDSYEDAVAALQLNGYMIGDTFIEVTPSSPSVLEQAKAFLSDFQSAAKQEARETIVRPGDWYCPDPACGYHNFASRKLCYKCGTPDRKPGSASPTKTHMTLTKPGDWMCPNPSCCFHNYASRMQCLRCSTNRTHSPMPDSRKLMSPMQAAFVRSPASEHMPLVSPSSASSSLPRSATMFDSSHQPLWPPLTSPTGEWRCANMRCQVQNDGHHHICPRCGWAQPSVATSKQPALPPRFNGPPLLSPPTPSTERHTQQTPPSPTLLAQSHAHMLANPNPIAASAPFRAGDWICIAPACGTHNFASRTTCLTCGTQRPSLNAPHSVHSPFTNGTNGLKPGSSSNSNSNSSFPKSYGNGGLIGVPGGGPLAFGPPRPPLNMPYYPPPPFYHPGLNGLGHMAPMERVSPASQLLPGDWLCPQPSCGYHNFARRKQCAKCGSLPSD
ncbi:Asparagine-rich protein (ARP protein) [Sorochytrium milnesiophthora]